MIQKNLALKSVNIVLSLFILVSFTKQTVSAATCPSQSVCSSVFAAPVQTNTTTGSIATTGNTYNNPLGTVLPASAGKVSQLQCSVSSSGGTSCTASGTSGGQLCPGTFLVSSRAGGNVSALNVDNKTLGGTNNSITDYGTVVVDNSGILNFTSKTSGTTLYKMTSLSVAGAGIVNLVPGDYWLGSLTMAASAVLNVVGSGTVRIFVNGDINYSGNTKGTANVPILLYGYSNLNLSGSCTINAAVYLQGNFNPSGFVTVNGAVSANNILGNGLNVYYNSSVINSLSLGSSCSLGLTGFTVSAPSTANYCGNTAVTVNAISSGQSTYTAYLGSILIDTQSGVGTWSESGFGAITNNTGNGKANYQFAAGDNGVVTFRLNYPANGTSPIIIKVNDTSSPTIFGLSNSVTFNPAGYVISATSGSTTAYTGNIKAGNTVTLYLTAYTGCGVTSSYTGVKTVKFWTTYVNPTSGTQALKVNGTAVATSSAATATTQAITFVNGIAAITVTYPDVGQLTLNATDTASSGPTGSSGNFVVYPDHFGLNIVNSNSVANAATNDTSGTAVTSCLADTVFTGAGQTFTVNVRPLNLQNVVTPNFGNETTVQTITLTGPVIAPASGSGTLNNITMTKMSSGTNPFGGTASATSPYFRSLPNFSDVGCINLTAGVTNYLATGATVSSSVVVGRFVPDHFAIQTGSNVTPILDTKNSSFTYMDQPFGFTTQPILVIQAQNAQNAATVNYTGSFAKLFATGLNYQYALGIFPANGTDTIPSLSLTPGSSTVITTAVPTVVSGTGTYTFTINDTNFGSASGFKIARTAGQLVPPFFAEIQLQVPTIKDTDLVQCDASCACISGVAGCTASPNANRGFAFGATTLGNGISFDVGKTFYFGRMIVQSTSGSELLNMAVPLQVQYYTSGGFVLNTADSTTSAASFASPNNPPTCPASGSPNPLLCAVSGFSTTVASVSSTFSSGQAILTLTASNALGYVDIVPQLQSSAANLPWLQFAWPSNSSNTTNAYTDNPRGRATFGISKGNDRKTYEKETFQ